MEAKRKLLNHFLAALENFIVAEIAPDPGWPQKGA